MGFVFFGFLMVVMRVVVGELVTLTEDQQNKCVRGETEPGTRIFVRYNVTGVPGQHVDLKV